MHTIEAYRPAFGAMGVDERRVVSVDVEEDPRHDYWLGGVATTGLPAQRGVTIRAQLVGGGVAVRWFAPGEVYARWQA